MENWHIQKVCHFLFQEGWPLPLPSAPPLEDVSPTRQQSVTARGLNSECSICLDKVVNVNTLATGPSCSKLTMSLVNDSLKFASSDTQIC